MTLEKVSNEVIKSANSFKKWCKTNATDGTEYGLCEFLLNDSHKQVLSKV